MNTLHVNIGLARYSDWAFTSAVVALVVALLLLAFELAYVGGRRADRPRASAAGPERRLPPTARRPASSRTPRSGRSTSASDAPAWPWSISASGCC